MSVSLLSAGSTTDSLSIHNFNNPPISARPGAFWNWLNGNTDRARLKYDLQQMKEKGMSGAEIWDVAAVKNSEMVPAGPEFLGPESAETIRFALYEAKKLGLRMGMITSSGWNAGGKWVDPSWASKMLVTSSLVTTGPLNYDQVLPFPEVPKGCPLDNSDKPAFYKDIAVLAFPENIDQKIDSMDSVLNITDALDASGKLHWKVPPGVWRIFRFVCTNTGQTLIVPSPKSSGLFIDFLDPDATRRHLQTIMDRLGITPSNAADSGLDYLEVDSMELHDGNPWTDKFADWFLKYRKYDPIKWMPVLAGWKIKDQSTTDAFLYDYKHTVSDLLIHSHYETGSEFLKQYGMDFVGEAGGPGPPIWNTCPVDALKALGNVSIPRGEFWIKHRNMFLIKEVASASHIYGKTLVDAESFTTWRRWEDSPANLKLSADRAFAEGLNHITIHGFAHSPDDAGLPGFTYHAGIDINPNTTWWRYARPFMDYLSRCSYMLQQGQPVADVLWYYGDQAPNFFPSFHDVPEKPRLPGLGHGFDYDVINSDVILNRLQVKNGRFVLPEGTSYKVLAFPDNAAMPLAVLQKLKSLVKQGGIISGMPPMEEPGLYKRAEKSVAIKDISKTLWGDEPTTDTVQDYGIGKVYGPKHLDDILRAEGVVADFSVSGWETIPGIDYIHRRTDDVEIYFVRNSETKSETITANFRVHDKTPKIWDPTTGEMRPCLSFKQEESRTSIDLKLEAGEAQFIVFDNGPVERTVARGETFFDLDILEPWTLEFPPDSGAPTSITLQRLTSWTKSADKGVRYFSGTATYNNTFTVKRDWLTSGSRIMIDMGTVYDVVQLNINGNDAGISWKSPYRLDITELVRGGENTIEINITNQWHNRLVGDAQTSESARITKTNTPLPAGGDKTLLPSGLLGPIRIIRE